MKDNVHEGHRKRLREQIMKNISNMHDHQLLECLLFYCIPRADTNEMAHRLINKAGDLSNVFSLSDEEICEIKNLGPKTAEFLHFINEILMKMQEEKQFKTNIMSEKRNFKEIFVEELRHINTRVFMTVTMDCRKYVMDYERIFNLHELETWDCFEKINQILGNQNIKYLMVAEKNPEFSFVQKGFSKAMIHKFNSISSAKGIQLVDYYIINGNNEIVSCRRLGLIKNIEY